MQNINRVAPATFSFESHNVRVITDGKHPLFVARDVALALGYKRPNDAITQFCKGAVKHRPLQTEGGMQEVRVIEEPDVYRLIFGSKLESAQKFQDWVFEEVLPSIAKDGAYQVQPRLSTVADRVPLKDAVNLLVARAGISYSDAYRMVHQRFAVDSVEELTLEQLPQAVEYVHKLVLSGELLPREEAPQEDIRSHQVAAIALMHTGWRRFEEQQRATRQLQGSIGAALGALDVAKAHLQAAFGDADAILHGSGAIWDGLHEALFHLHLPVDVMKEGRQRAETNYSPRILA